MVKFRTAVRPEEVSQSARHRLFVEGSKSSDFDPEVIKELFRDISIIIEPLGPSMNIRAAAEALHPYHPDYYFLIDRDHHDAKFVGDTWKNFPDPEKSNLIVWRRCEFENYLIIPEYLERSQYLTCTGQELRDQILQTVRPRIYFDAVNRVIVLLREELKENWITIFQSITGMETKEKALKCLLSLAKFESKRRSVTQLLRKDRIEKIFEKIIGEWLGGRVEPEYGHGNWIEMVKGKKILPTIVNNCFQLKDMGNQPVVGKEAVKEVAKNLLRLPLTDQPQDFQALHRLIKTRVKS